MLELLPGTNLANVRGALVEARRSLTEARNGFGIADRYNSYNTWAANAVNQLRYQLAPADVDRLITTRLYWSLLGKSPVDVGPALVPLVDNELQARDTALLAEIGLFDAEVAGWGNGQAVAVVPDTTVLIEMGGTFADREWHTLLDLRPHESVLLVVTMAAVAELDAKKLSRDQTSQGQQVRTGVRAALKRIEELFPDNDWRTRIDHSGTITSTVTTVLLTDTLAHEPLPSADAEMISRGLSILPYAGRCIFVTYDLNQAFRARTAGLEAKRLKYEDEIESA
jgi:hypothetical protein